MDRKQLFIDWVSANKLKNITPEDFVNLLEHVFLFYCKKDIWRIDNFEEYDTLCKELILNKKFKKSDKIIYKKFVTNARFYYKFLEINRVEFNCCDISKVEKKELISENVNEYLKEQTDIRLFFDNEKIRDVFFKLFIYTKKKNQLLELDVRSAIIGVKLANECLRFYSDREGNVKFVGIKKSVSIDRIDIEELYNYIDEVNLYFENYQYKNLQVNDEPKGYIYHSYFGFGKIVERDDKTIKVMFDDIEGKKIIQAGHHSYIEISEKEYEYKKNKVETKENRIKFSGDDHSPFKKICWDKHETALLIEAFWKIENKEGNRTEILAELSKALRQKAINQGKKIDNKFRNYNGMSMQLANLTASFFPNRAAMHKTAIFMEIAELYKNNREEFNKLLSEAHKIVTENINHEIKTNYVCKIDFNNRLDLDFTQPRSVIYFGNRKDKFDNWIDCYKYIMQCLYDDYPHVILDLAKDSSYSLISSESKQLNCPLKIVENIFAEGDRNTSDLMKHIKTILDKCDVNYENVIIEFAKKDDLTSKNSKKSSPVYSIEIYEVDFYSYIKEKYEDNHKNDGKAYLAIKHAQQCVDFIREINNLLSINVFKITEKKEIKRILITLSEIPINANKRTCFSYVIKRYYHFLVSKNESYEEKIVKKNIELKSEKLDVSDYCLVIKSQFPDGYAFTNPLRKKRFIREYAKITGKEFSDSDNVYNRKIRQVGFISEEKVYLPSIISDEIKKGIKIFIDSFLEKSPVVYYSVIYQAFNEKLSSAFGEDMLKNYITFIFKNMYSFSDMFVASKGMQVDMKRVLIETFLNCGCPLNIDEIYNKLPNISRDAINAIIKDKDFIVNFKGKSYFYKDIFVIDDIELNAIKTFIIKKIQEKESVNGTELYSFINDKLPNLIESNPGVTDLGFKNILKLKLIDNFNFKGDIISAIDQELDIHKLYKNFCKQREKFTISELKEFKNSIKQSYIDWDVVLMEAVRINSNTFIRRDYINFDVQKIDNAIDSYFSKDYISFNDVINFTEFPSIGYTWNNYVLESYLFVNSIKFKLLHASFNGDKPVGGIVKSNSNIKDFDDLLVRVIKNSKLFDVEKAFDFLLENDFIRIRKIKNIDSLIEIAKKEG